MENEYNVKKYTDAELYKILNLNADVTDRILEGKIMLLKNRYENMQTPAGDQLAEFFNQVHLHFFSEEQDEDEDEAVEEEIEQEGFQTKMVDIKKKEGEDNDKTEEPLVKGIENVGDEQYLNKDGVSTDQPVVLTKEVVSSKGVVNPLIQQTIQRVVSIDSQYREDKNKLATDFSFILSEPLRDVVSLSLYSVQIPYTWYTVNSNFLVLLVNNTLSVIKIK